MEINKFLFFILTICVLVRADRILDLIELRPSSIAYDQPTICQLNENEVKSLLTLSEQSTNNQKSILIRIHENEDSFINDIRSQLSALGYRVCSFESSHESLVVANITIVNNDGHVIPYYGRRDPSTLIRFLAHLEQRISKSPYHTINGKLDKKAYEHVLEPKIIAYYPDITAPAFTQFQQAAKLMAPSPPFFVVHDPQLAAKFRLNQPGQISLVRRLEKSQIFFPSPTLSMMSSEPTQTINAQDIIQWIQENRGLVMHELKDTNLYEPEIHDPNKYQMVAVGDKSSPLGLYFYKILTKTIQNISRENEIKLNHPLTTADNVNEDEDITNSDAQADIQPNEPVDLIRLDDVEIVWIDLQQFPSASLNLQKLFQIEPVQNVWFGLIHSPPTAIATQGLDSVWFDLNGLNLTRSDRQTDQANIWLVRDWILSVTDREMKSVTNNSSAGEPSAFVLEPEPVSVRQGGNFLLECQVLPHLKCSWMKDSQSIVVDDVNGSRYRYAIPSRIGGDCSLMVKGARIEEDQGEWTCLVEGTTEKSMPIKVNVRYDTKTEL
ncbi:Calsequestrin-2 [Dermatophagoides pteronyssinus]|uniref:Calsequestrin n=1 Tax=Dermatophagoides pteronyssinus TaxID=6956 RepID=A0ABQ8IZU2_DERPT|nr:Calsequestrin-2 [Dermatophagoides pteronyssinus]